MNVDLEQDDQGQHFLLMDGSLDARIIQQYFELDEDPEYVPLFLGHDNLLAISPYLVQIKHSSKPFIDWYIHHSHQWGFLYYSKHSLNEQFEYWQSLLEVISPDGQENLLRFSDGKVALTLWNLFTEDEKLQFFQPCSTLYFQSSDQEWMRYELAPTPPPLQFNPDKPWFSLSHKMLEAIDISSDDILIENIIDSLWQHYPEKLERLPDNLALKLTQYGIERAKHLQITTEKQISTFVFLMFEYAPNFFQDKKVKSVFDLEQDIQPVEFGNRALHKIINTLTNQDWERINANSNLEF